MEEFYASRTSEFLVDHFEVHKLTQESLSVYMVLLGVAIVKFLNNLVNVRLTNAIYVHIKPFFKHTVWYIQQSYKNISNRLLIHVFDE